MATFPILSSGAVTQYPIRLLTRQSVQIIRFLDGSDQRFLSQARQYRRWGIQLDLLSESELQALESFFALQKGTYSAFTFPDPFTKSSIPNCRIGSSEMATEYLACNIGASSLWVIETNG